MDPLDIKSPKYLRIIYHWEIQDKKCYYCEKSLVKDLEVVDADMQMGAHVIEFEAFDIDHKIPTSKGGTNSALNTCLSCLACNRMKGDMTEAEFKKALIYIKTGFLKQTDIGDFVRYVQLKDKFDRLGVRPEDFPLKAHEIKRMKTVSEQEL